MHNNTHIQQLNTTMVYYTDTLEPLHGLTESGEEMYRKLLEQRADEILFKSKHPIKYWWQRLRNWVKYGDSEWLGPEYGEDEKYKDGFSYTGHQD